MHGMLYHKARLALRGSGGRPGQHEGRDTDNHHRGQGGNGGHHNHTPTSSTSETTTPAESSETTVAAATTTTPTTTEVAATTEIETSTNTSDTAQTTSAASSNDNTSSAQTAGDGASSTTSNGSAESAGGSTGTAVSPSSQTTAVDLTGTGTASATTATALASETTSSGSSSSATSSASASLSSSTSDATKSSSHSNAGVIAGVVVAVALLAIIGFLVYRFRRSPFMQRALAPFRKGSRDSSSHIGPYYHMEKDDGTAPNMTGETLIGTSNMRAMGPVGAATTSANPNNLTVDTNHLQGRSVWPVSPISPQSRSAASDVSPVSPDPTMFPLQQPSPISNPEPGTAISVAGSEARIVSIPARQSRVLGDGGSGVGGDAVPAAEWRPPPMRGPPSTRAAVVPSSTRGPSRRNPARRPSRSSAGGRGGGSYRHPAQWTDGSEDLRPPPLSINKYPTMMASHAPVAELNGGYKAYRPMLGSGNAAAARSLTQNRVSHASTGASSIASSDAFSPEAWPMPPGTPRTSPGRH